MPTLFAAMFVAQAGLLSLGPVLPDVAREFGVSTAAAGQLRTLGGLAGGATAVAVALFGSRLRLRGMLTAGHLMLALGALGSAAAVGVRAATGQFGYLVGAAVGGAALAAGGYKVLVVSLAARFALGTVPHLTRDPLPDRLRSVERRQ